MSSPIPRFNPLPVDAVEKWHSQADIDDPPFKRPMLAQMAHVEARNRAANRAEQIRDSKAAGVEKIHQATERALAALAQVVICAALLVGLMMASLLPALYVSVTAGVGALVFVVSVFSAVRAKRALFNIATRQKLEVAELAAQKDAAEKEADEHWNKFVKLTTEADSKIKVLQDAPVEPPS